MFLIAHRGNYKGKVETRENHPAHIAEALCAGFHCEIDVWWHKNRFYLGHDAPMYPIDYEFFIDERLWCHAKNPKAMEVLLQLPQLNAFWHETDYMAVTTKNYMWSTNPLAEGLGTIFMHIEHTEFVVNPFNIGGICADNVARLVA